MPVRVGESRPGSWPGTIADARPAAVLVLVVPTPAGEAAVVLIERATGGRHHSGEVSFPGGRAEDADDDLVATAIREAEEEIGLDAARGGASASPARSSRSGSPSATTA